MAANTYLKFLYLLMLNRFVDSKAITLYFGSMDKGTYYRQKVLADGFARKQTVYADQDKHAPVTVFCLTKAGLNFIISHDRYLDELFEPSYAPFPYPIHNRMETKQEKKLRLIRRSTALILAHKAGAVIPIENYTTLIRDVAPDSDGYSLTEFIRDNLTSEIYTYFNPYGYRGQDQDITFHTDLCMKVAAGGINNAANIQDYLNGRFSGIVDIKKKSVLLYTAPPAGGLSWTKWRVDKEELCYRIWVKLHQQENLIEIKRSGSCAALIVDNPKAFFNLYYNKDKSPTSKNYVFGDPFTHFYIIPATLEGAGHLRWLITTNDGDVNRQLISKAINSGRFSRNTQFFVGLFPLVNQNKEFTALGFHLDVKVMQTIEQKARENPDQKFNVLCFDWQTAYYKIIMPNNVSITDINTNAK